MYTAELTTLLTDVRERLREKIESFEPNATYKKAPELRDYLDLNIVKAVTHAVAGGQRYYMVGSAGIGKTSFVRWFVEQVLGYKLVYIPAAQISIENLMVPFPADDPEFGVKVLETLFFKNLVDDSPKVIFIDEIGRADASLGNTLMELLQEGTLGGKKVPNLVTVLAADNPAGSSYGKMSGLDFSQADRFATVTLTSKDTPWRRALAEQFKTTDLEKVFSAYDTLPAEVREVLNPRVLAFTIKGLLAGFPGLATLPMVNGKRVMLTRKGDTNASEVAKYTKSVLDRIASALGTVNRDTIPNIVERAIQYAVSEGENVYIQGPPGCGKTSFIKAELERLGVRSHYNSAAVMQPEDMSVPFPSGDGRTLELMPMRQFVDPDPWVWILDEIARGSRRTQNALMEPIQERTLGGNPTGLIATIALNNPREHAGMSLDVGKNDLAQASRFALSIEVQPENIPWTTFLFGRYGEETATPFVEWWQDDIDDVGRGLVTPRGIERMINVHEAGNPISWALPYVNGDYVKVPLAELQARLDKRPMARLRQIVARVDDYEEMLAAGKDEYPMEHATVFLAFHKAELSQLKDVRDVCLRLFGVLDKQHRIDLIRQAGERQSFWNGVLQESSKTKKK